jgi:hypothetical protein
MNSTAYVFSSIFHSLRGTNTGKYILQRTIAYRHSSIFHNRLQSYSIGFCLTQTTAFDTGQLSHHCAEGKKLFSSVRSTLLIHRDEGPFSIFISFLAD